MKKYIRTFLVSALIITIIVIAFKGFAQIALATRVGKPETVATNYQISSVSSNSKNSTKSQESYKPNYEIADVDKPTSMEITREEAAEIGVKNLYSVFGLDMNDKVIGMTYIPAQNGFRPIWCGTLDMKVENSIVASYTFSVDSISGEIEVVGYERVLEEKVDTGFDQNLEQNAQEYENLAKELSVKIGAIQGTVKSAEYESQGGTGNGEPTILIRVTGENGEEALLDFSRYDKKLLSVSYNTTVKTMDAYNNLK